MAMPGFQTTCVQQEAAVGRGIQGENGGPPRTAPILPIPGSVTA